MVHGSGCVCFGLVAVGWGGLMQVPRRPSIHVLQLRLTSLSLRRPSPQNLTLTGGARIITWHLWRIFLGECWQSSRHFWNLPAYVGYGLMHDTHNKKGLVPYLRIHGTLYKYQWLYLVMACLLVCQRDVCWNSDAMVSTLLFWLYQSGNFYYCRTVTKWFKEFCPGGKSFDNPVMSGRPNTIDFNAML